MLLLIYDMPLAGMPREASFDHLLHLAVMKGRDQPTNPGLPPGASRDICYQLSRGETEWIDTDKATHQKFHNKN